MIKNFVFDLGGVIIRFDGNYFIEREGITDPDDRRILLEKLFLSEEWPQMDRGDLNEEEFFTLLKKKLPERLFPVAEHLLFHWADPIEIIPETQRFIKAAKKNGWKLWLLSNAPESIHKVLPKVSGLELFDGTIVSADIHMAKPNVDIFVYALRKFDIRPEESIFIDDRMVNVLGARKAGFHSWLYRETAGETVTAHTETGDFAFAGSQEQDLDQRMSFAETGEALILDSGKAIRLTKEGELTECSYRLEGFGNHDRI